MAETLSMRRKTQINQSITCDLRGTITCPNVNKVFEYAISQERSLELIVNMKPYEI